MYNSGIPIGYMHCKNKDVSSTLNAQHTYGVHAHLFPSGVLCTDAHMHSSSIVP